MRISFPTAAFFHIANLKLAARSAVISGDCGKIPLCRQPRSRKPIIIAAASWAMMMGKTTEFRTFPCGHVRDALNTTKRSRCLTCDRAYRSKWNRARYRRLREEGLTSYETCGYRPLTQDELAGMVRRMGDGMTMCQATAAPSRRSKNGTLYRKLRIWAPAHHDQIVLIKRLSKLNVSTQRYRRLEARRPVDEPDTFPRIDPKNLDYTLIEEITRGVVFADVDLRAEIRPVFLRWNEVPGEAVPDPALQ